jgi:hypothetical protein
MTGLHADSPSTRVLRRTRQARRVDFGDDLGARLDHRLDLVVENRHGGVWVELPAARLCPRESNFLPETLEQLDGGDSRLGKHRVADAGHEERDTHAARYVCS